MKTIILKLGGSLITKKHEDRPEVNRKTLNRLAGEIAEALKETKLRLVIVHGAGPYGHVPAKEYELTGGYKSERQTRGMALTHRMMERLNAQVVDALIEAGVDAIAYQPSAAGLLENRRLIAFPLESVKRLLDLRLVPVAYGDVLPDRKTGLNILSGDQLVPYLARQLDADRVIIATSHNGIFDRSPEEKGALKFDFLDAKSVAALDARKTKGTDVTGGIGGKVRELLALSGEGIPSEIISGNEPDYVMKALTGIEGLGTRIV